MVTKEQCLMERILDAIGYGNNPRLAQYVLASFNQGKKYASDMLFMNDERGLDEGLQGYSPSFIVYSLIGDDSDYDPRSPFFTVGSGIVSVDEYDFRRMLTPQDIQKIVNQDVLDELDDSDWYDAFEMFLKNNYPQIYQNFDYDVLDGYSSYDFMKANWNELAKSLSGQQPQQQPGQVQENTVKITGNDLRNMTNQILKEILSKKK